MIRKCKCNSPFQDKYYGPGLRCFTVGKKMMTCTVCGTKELLPNQPKAAKEKEADSSTA